MIDLDKFEKFERLVLKKGGHEELPEEEAQMCAMEAAAWLASENWSDSPKCVCPVIAAFVRRWNDDFLDDSVRTQYLKPLVPILIDTRAPEGECGDQVMRARALMAVDWEIRVRTPAFLRFAGLDKQADDLATLPEIEGRRSLEAARPALEDAHVKATEKCAAFWESIRGAPRGEAGGVAKAEAWEAMRSISRGAAWGAAWLAVEALMETLTDEVLLIEALGWSSSVERVSCSDAAGEAAWAGPREKLRETVEQIYVSAQELICRMCEVGCEVVEEEECGSSQPETGTETGVHTE